MREPRKLRKLLCRLMWLSSSSLILPKTYRREEEGSALQVRARQPGKQLQLHHVHIPIFENIPGQAGQGSEHPDLAEDVPAMGLGKVAFKVPSSPEHSLTL